MDSREPVELGKQVDSVEPMEMDLPAESDKPVDSNEPIKITKQRDSEELMALDEPVNSSRPVEMSKKVNTVEPVESDEPVELGKPVDSVEIVESDEPLELGKPVDLIELVESNEPLQLGKIVDLVEIVEYVEPLELGKPVDLIELVESNEPLQLGKIVDLVEIVEYVEPLELGKPVDLVEILESDEPLELVKLVDLVEIVEYHEPLQLGKPVDLEVIVESDEPVELDKPVNLVESVESDEPLELGKQVNSVEAAEQVEPVELGKPVKWDAPIDLKDSDKSSDTGESSESDKTSKTGEINESYDSLIKINNALYAAYTNSINLLVFNLRTWRVKLEEEKYRPINFDAPLPVWARKDKKKMRLEMYNISYELRKQRIMDKMSELNKIAKKIDDIKLVEEMIEMLLQDIYLLRVTPWEDVMYPLSMENLYDWDKVSKAIQGSHTPAECQELWHTKLHPSARNKSWSKAETRALAVLAGQFNLSNWDQIALELNTQRSGSQCFLQYRRYLHKDMMLQTQKIASKQDD